MTATSQASDAAERLREIVKPGGTVSVVGHGYTRSGVRRITIHGPVRVGGGWASTAITNLVADVLDLRYIPNSGYLPLREGYTPGSIADRLSAALFGETGLIKGEYL